MESPPLSNAFDSKRWIDFFQPYLVKKHFVSIGKLLPYVTGLLSSKSSLLRISLLQILSVNVVKKDVKLLCDVLVKLSFREESISVKVEICKIFKSSLELISKEADIAKSERLAWIVLLEYCSSGFKDLHSVANNVLKGMKISNKHVKSIFLEIFENLDKPKQIFVEKEVLVYMGALHTILKDSKGPFFSIVMERIGNIITETFVKLPFGQTHNSSIKFRMCEIVGQLELNFFLELFVKYLCNIEKNLKGKSNYLDVWNKDVVRVIYIFVLGFQERKKTFMSNELVNVMFVMMKLPLTEFKKSINLENFHKVILLLLSVIGMFDVKKMEGKTKGKMIKTLIQYVGKNEFINTEICEAAQKLLKLFCGGDYGNEFELIFGYLKEHYQLGTPKEDGWTLINWLVPSTKYFIRNLKFPFISSKVLEVLIPVVFRIVDNLTISRRMEGIFLLNHVFDEATKTSLRLYKGLIFQRLNQLLVFREVELLELSLPCAISALKVLIPKDVEVMSNSKECTDVFKRFMECLEYCNKVEQKIVSLTNFRVLIQYLGSVCIKHVRCIVDVLLSNEYLGNYSRENVFCESVKCVIELCRQCWPMIDIHFQSILKVVGNSELRNGKTSKKEVDEMLKIMSKIVGRSKLLKKIEIWELKGKLETFSL